MFQHFNHERRFSIQKKYHISAFYLCFASPEILCLYNLGPLYVNFKHCLPIFWVTLEYKRLEDNSSVLRSNQKILAIKFISKMCKISSLWVTVISIHVRVQFTCYLFNWNVWYWKKIKYDVTSVRLKHYNVIMLTKTTWSSRATIPITIDINCHYHIFYKKRWWWKCE